MAELLVKGGWVMYSILGCSIVALAIVIERAVVFLRAVNDDGALIEAVEEALEQAEFLRSSIGIPFHELGAMIDEWNEKE